MISLERRSVAGGTGPADSLDQQEGRGHASMATGPQGEKLLPIPF
jgi:hypothetical protein